MAISLAKISGRPMSAASMGGRRLLLAPSVLASSLLGLPPHRSACRVLAFDPTVGVAGHVARTLALGDDAFKSKLAGILEDNRAILLSVLVELDSLLGAANDPRQHSLPFLQGVSAHIVPVKLDQVESI